MVATADRIHLIMAWQEALNDDTYVCVQACCRPAAPAPHLLLPSLILPHFASLPAQLISSHLLSVQSGPTTFPVLYWKVLRITVRTYAWYEYEYTRLCRIRTSTVHTFISILPDFAMIRGVCLQADSKHGQAGGKPGRANPLLLQQGLAGYSGIWKRRRAETYRTRYASDSSSSSSAHLRERDLARRGI